MRSSLSAVQQRPPSPDRSSCRWPESARPSCGLAVAGGHDAFANWLRTTCSHVLYASKPFASAGPLTGIKRMNRSRSPISLGSMESARSAKSIPFSFRPFKALFAAASLQAS